MLGGVGGISDLLHFKVPQGIGAALWRELGDLEGLGGSGGVGMCRWIVYLIGWRMAVTGLFPGGLIG
jgi:hypothetical protein